MRDSKATQIWETLDSAWQDHEPMPTVRELVSTLGFSSTSVASYHLAVLERAQIIRRDPGRARSIRLLKPYPR